MSLSVNPCIATGKFPVMKSSHPGGDGEPTFRVVSPDGTVGEGFPSAEAAVANWNENNPVPELPPIPDEPPPAA